MEKRFTYTRLRAKSWEILLRLEGKTDRERGREKERERKREGERERQREIRRESERGGGGRRESLRDRER